MLLAEHFVKPPNWTWLILGYFFLAGLSSGCYALGVMLRLWGRPSHGSAARIAFLAAFPLVIVCPILLTVDLGQPTRFWHMLIDSAGGGLNFKYWSPMSLGVWGLGVFSGFAFLSFLGEIWAPVGRLLHSLLGGLLLVVGLVFALFVGAYTGVLLSVSNQPVWSDGWPLGGLFLASGLSGATALLLLLIAARHRSQVAASVGALGEADRYFVVIEAVLIVIFLVTVAAAGTIGRLFNVVGIGLWVLVLVGLTVPLLAHSRSRVLWPVLTSLLVLIGVLALRAAVIFGGQS